jgi:hypothetical protein
MKHGEALDRGASFACFVVSFGLHDVSLILLTSQNIPDARQAGRGRGTGSEGLTSGMALAAALGWMKDAVSGRDSMPPPMRGLRKDVKNGLHERGYRG